MTDLLLHSEQLHDVHVVEFFQDLKLPHLDVERPQETQVVEHLDGVQVASFLHTDVHVRLRNQHFLKAVFDSQAAGRARTGSWTQSSTPERGKNPSCYTTAMFL